VNLRQSDHSLIDIDQGDLFHLGVFKHLIERPAVTTANDGDPLGRFMGVEDRMGKHFVVDEVIPGTEHDEAIYDHYPPEVGGFVDLNLLIAGLFFVKLGLYSEGMRRACLLAVFSKPPVIAQHGWRFSFCRGMKAP